MTTSTKTAAKTRAPRKLQSVPPPKLSREVPASGGPSEMEQAIQAMPEHYLRCREDRHHWVSFTARRAAHGNFERVRRCDSCGGIKWQLLDGRFRVIEQKPIQYPEGYLMQGLGRLTGDDLAVVRGLNFLRELAQDDAANPVPAAKRARRRA